MLTDILFLKYPCAGVVGVCFNISHLSVEDVVSYGVAYAARMVYPAAVTTSEAVDETRTKVEDDSDTSPCAVLLFSHCHCKFRASRGPDAREVSSFVIYLSLRECIS